ncbi:uncharacterized protein YkwD [Litorimonas taeanensis]|uniref:Uncharacterized protein YkwD n=1 Tax=Litorimonas taeanensis TaxID=568099 RepID=A0A420WL01_9PROT|nr:CAP domain-containing protein [Litorimonas taeanensis]RKQ71565.1 uncharacterized protein YkwD [Litorimonas taeanensis]
MPYSIMRINQFVLSIGALLLSSTSAMSAEENISDFKEDDGTYAIKDVRSQEECSELCKSDKKCRGAVTYQADVTKPEMVCRLNNGFGKNAVFPSIPPEPLDLKVAIADLNAYRAEFGLGALKLNTKLNKASKVHAEDLAKAGIISHTGTDGSGHGDRVQRQGYYFMIAGENVATGQKSWKKVFQAWKDSPGHNENLLRDDVIDFGIALVYEPKTTYSTYWAMLVASPMEEQSFATGVN